MSYDYRAHFGEVTLTQDLMSRRDERRWRLTPAPAAGEHHDIVLYLGCNVLRTSHMVRTVTALFDLLGLDYVAVGGPSYCCGIVHHTQGDTAAARGMSEGTIRLFERFSPREVVMWCPSCIYFYDEVQQLTLPFPFRQAAEFLVEHLPALRFIREVRQRVALHYHVQNDSRRREGAAGRTLLEAVPGLTFVPIEPEARFGRICTAGVQQELGRPSVFARGLGIEFEDTYKRWTLSGDPEAIMAEATPCMEANGVDAGAARAFVQRTFVPLRRAPSGTDAATPS
jgi:Fe-S oxidoreductase